MTLDANTFIRLRLQTAYEYFDDGGMQVMASDVQQCFAALDRLEAQQEDYRLLIHDAAKCAERLWEAEAEVARLNHDAAGWEADFREAEARAVAAEAKVATKEAAQEYYRIKVDLPAAESRVAALEAALDDAALALDAVAALVTNYHVRPKANGPTFKPAEIAIHAAFVARAALAEGVNDA